MHIRKQKDLDETLTLTRTIPATPRNCPEDKGFLKLSKSMVFKSLRSSIVTTEIIQRDPKMFDQVKNRTIQTEKTYPASECLPVVGKRRKGVRNDKRISQIVEFTDGISLQARKFCLRQPKNIERIVKNSENFRVCLRKPARNGKFNRHRQITINRILDLSSRSYESIDRILVKIRKTKIPINHKSKIRPNISQKITPNFLESLEHFLPKSVINSEPESMMFYSKLSTSLKRKRMKEPWSYKEIKYSLITVLNLDDTSINYITVREMRSLLSSNNKNILKMLRYRVKPLYTTLKLNFYLNLLAKNIKEFKLAPTSTAESSWNSLESVIHKSLAFNFYNRNLQFKAASLISKRVFLKYFKVISCFFLISLMGKYRELLNVADNFYFLKPSLTYPKDPDSIKSYEDIYFCIATKATRSILELRLMNILNLSTAFEYFLTSNRINFKFHLQTKNAPFFQFLKKIYYFILQNKNPDLPSTRALKGYDFFLDEIVITGKYIKTICKDNFLSPKNNTDMPDDNNCVKYIHQHKKSIRKPKVKKQGIRSPVKSPYFSSNILKKSCKYEAYNKPTKLPNRGPSFSSHFKISEKIRTIPQGVSQRYPYSGAISCIPFPPLSKSYFGLIQEKLVDNPFHLLIAMTILTRTHGIHALPIFHALINQYPSPESFLAANKQDIVSIINCLGFQNQRANTFKSYASIWLKNPPTKNKRYAVHGYPNRGSGRDIKKDEVLLDSDKRDAWEIGHLTSGPYTLDSWRIFCRDKLRRVAAGWNGEGAYEGFQPEWMRVLPQDKELRAFLQWMWLKEGFLWNSQTGEKEVANTELMIAAQEGRVVWDDVNGLRITK